MAEFKNKIYENWYSVNISIGFFSSKMYICLSKTNCQQNYFAWCMFKALLYVFHKKKHQEK